MPLTEDLSMELQVMRSGVKRVPREHRQRHTPPVPQPGAKAISSADDTASLKRLNIPEILAVHIYYLQRLLICGLFTETEIACLPLYQSPDENCDAQNSHGMTPKRRLTVFIQTSGKRQTEIQRRSLISCFHNLSPFFFSYVYHLPIFLSHSFPTPFI
jgi:hypothetical protein